MTRNEFVDQLQRTLAGGLGSGQVAEHVRYYQDYIDSEIRKGQTEEEILGMLGDPRLLAKSIIEANKRTGASEGTNAVYDETVSDDAYEDGRKNTFKSHRIPGWLLAVMILLVVIVVFGLAFSLLSVFWPVLLVVAVIAMIGRATGQR